MFILCLFHLFILFFCRAPLHDCLYKMFIVQQERQTQPLEVFYKNIVLKTFAKFTEKYLCLALQLYLKKYSGIYVFL